MSTHGTPQHNQNSNSVITSAQATLHCLTGCVIGEVAGLAIGVTLGLGIWTTIGLATFLAYISGFTLGVLPVMRREKKTFSQALKIIWIGEAVSIGVMEIAMNFADYQMGGMNAGSVFEPVFWYAIMVAIPAGFLAAWPVNWWLLRRNLKNCH
ncbi:MAG: hypothetical protein DHS20C05_06940 [Hyphococcus sp.]|nr:MAG: hypothetical protein DHS20C05_06940 [Marinicaulis sp.]